MSRLEPTFAERTGPPCAGLARRLRKTSSVRSTSCCWRLVVPLWQWKLRQDPSPLLPIPRCGKSSTRFETHPDRAVVYEEMANPHVSLLHGEGVSARRCISGRGPSRRPGDHLLSATSKDSERPPRIIFKALAAQPDLFVQMLEWIYRPEDAGEGEETAAEDATPDVVRRAEACDGILRAWDGIPGDLAETPAERERTLATWVATVLDLAAKRRRSKVGLIKVAEVLARAPAAADGVWPAIAARELLEGGRFPDLARHMTIARTNSRGMTSRGHLDGGDQEREMARTYREWAQKIRTEFPRTAALLDGLVARYEHEARQNDEAVRPDRTRFGK